MRFFQLLVGKYRSRDRVLAVLPLLLCATPRVAVVRAPVENGLIERIRGQASDLAWRVNVVPAPGWSDEDPLTSAHAFAYNTRADLVLWVCDSTLFIVPADQDRLFRRTVGEPDRSAALESMALMARSAMLTINDGGEFGAPVVRADPPAPPAEPTPVVEAPAEPAPTPIGYRIAAGWRGGFDGDFTSHGPTIGTSVVVSPWRFGASVSPGLSDQVQDDVAVITATRHDIAITVARSFGQFLAAAGAGAALYLRESAVVDPAFHATPDSTTTAFIATAEAGFELNLTTSLLAQVRAGFEATLGAPEYTVSSDDGPTSFSAPWALQPRLTLALVYQGAVQ